MLECIDDYLEAEQAYEWYDDECIGTGWQSVFASVAAWQT